MGDGGNEIPEMIEDLNTEFIKSRAANAYAEQKRISQ